MSATLARREEIRNAALHSLDTIVAEPAKDYTPNERALIETVLLWCGIVIELTE